MTYSIPQTLVIAKISQYLAANDIASAGLYAGGVDVNLPRKIYLVRKNLEWIYDLDPASSELTGVGNYLLSLCSKYRLKAQSLIAGGGIIVGGVVVPISPYLIPITGADFSDATHYNDARIVGHNLAIFWDGVNRYINSPSEWSSTATGFQINIAGFDATLDPTTHFEIFILN